VGEREGAVLSEQAPKRKLIEVSLPLEVINRESAREKSIRHGHPSTLHLWWARRPLAAARAVLFAQLVDDPSSHPEKFPTEEAQQAERERLHKLIERLVVWENSRDEELIAEAHNEILESTGGKPPPILDPFAGGGTIPLEAQRLGLEAHASDLNPVAVLINKALIEIPPKFADRPPVFPGLAETEMAGWKGATGLAADVRAYGEWMRDEAEALIGEHYPKAKLPDGTEATVIAWIWARTVTCPNPACRIEMPLVRSWWLGKRNGKEAYVVPEIIGDREHRSGRRVEFRVGHELAGAPLAAEDGTVGRSGAKCVACGSVASLEYVREASRDSGLGTRLLATVVEGQGGRIYLPPDQIQQSAARELAGSRGPEGALPDAALGFRVQNYGLTEWADLFTSRQILALRTVSDLIGRARERLIDDVGRGGTPTESLAAPGNVEAYADAVATYLALAVSRMTDYQSAIATWSNHPRNEVIVHVFGRQAIPMVWDFAEGNPFRTASGSYLIMVNAIAKVLDGLPARGGAIVSQGDARLNTMEGLLSTDPPYYDNVGYSDLSDYFYVWLRQSLREVYPDMFRTMLVPKEGELVANPYRHDGKNGAKQYFEDGFREFFTAAREGALPGFPIAVYYAFKQSETAEDGESSTGWETLLDGMIQAGWAITATWPMRTESQGRLRANRANALASSIVLALRPRSNAAAATDRRGLIAALQAELPDALRDLQQGAIAPVDLPQAAIGPGMAVFSRYSSVLEADGSLMSVRSALARINEILDQVLNEQEGDFDPTSRFAIAWYRQHGYDIGKFDDANNLANARNTTVEEMARSGILGSAAGKVTLLAPAALLQGYSPVDDEQISAWEVLHHMIAALERGGIEESALLLAAAGSRADDPVDADLLKELTFLLFSIAEKNGWAQDALAFNTLATAWPEILDASRDAGSQVEQASFDIEDA
jgi:putative DNA methylase